MEGAGERRDIRGARPTGGRQDVATVRIGSSVRLKYGELEEAWRIADSAEADAQQGVISPETPLARALLGHQAGDTVHVRGTLDRYSVTILDVV